MLGFHSGVQVTLVLDVPGVNGEPGGVVWLLVDAVGDDGRPGPPVASSW